MSCLAALFLSLSLFGILSRARLEAIVSPVANQRRGSRYQIGDRFNICQQTQGTSRAPAQGLSISTQRAAAKRTTVDGRGEETEMLNREMSLFPFILKKTLICKAIKSSTSEPKAEIKTRTGKGKLAISPKVCGSFKILPAS